MDELLQSDFRPSLRAIPLFSGVNMLKLEPREAQAVANTLLRKRGKPAASFNRGTWRPTRASIHVDVDGIVGEYQDANPGYKCRDFAFRDGVRPSGVARGQDCAGRSICEQSIWIVGLRDESGTCVTTQASRVHGQDRCVRLDLARFCAGTSAGRDVVQSCRKNQGLSLEGDEGVQFVNQLLKYVDWVANTRAGGDYELIEAFLVASAFDEQTKRFARRGGRRRYIIPRRPYQSAV